MKRDHAYFYPAKLLVQRSSLPELIGKVFFHPMEETLLSSIHPPDKLIPTSGTCFLCRDSTDSPGMLIATAKTRRGRNAGM